MSLKALVGSRTSVMTDSKVSYQAQHKSGDEHADRQGWQVIGHFEDLGVSASVSPWDRPDLGPWLTEERHHEWQVIIWAKVDRAFRSMVHCVQFTQWAKDHRKIMVFSDDNLTLDYTKPDSGSFDSMMSNFFLLVAGFFAEIELNRFRTRAQDAHAVLRTTDRWASGKPAFGFRVIDHPSGKGKSLTINEDEKKILYDVAGRLVNGESFTNIAVEMTKQTGRDWNTTNVIRMLTGLQTQGVKMHKLNPVLDEHGNYIRVGPPLFDDQTWETIQTAAAERSQGRRTRTYTKNPMLGIGYCGICGASLAQQFTHEDTRNFTRRQAKDPTVERRVYRTYRCGRTPINCKGVSVRADEADETLQDTFLHEKGDRQVEERYFVPGEDRSLELQQCQDSIRRLRQESDMGLIDDEEMYFQRMKALTRRKKELETSNARPSGWEIRVLDKTYADVWEDSDPEEKRKMLIDAGVKFTVYSKYEVKTEIS